MSIWRFWRLLGRFRDQKKSEQEKLTTSPQQTDLLANELVTDRTALEEEPADAADPQTDDDLMPEQNNPVHPEDFSDEEEDEPNAVSFEPPETRSFEKDDPPSAVSRRT